MFAGDNVSVKGLYYVFSAGCEQGRSLYYMFVVNNVCVKGLYYVSSAGYVMGKVTLLCLRAIVL